MSEPNDSSQSGRRDFLVKAAAVGIGAVTTLVPAGAGLVTLLDPLRHKAKAGRFLRVATLNSLPEDGTPRQFPVVSERQDA